MKGIHKVAVVIPCFNHGAYLGEAIQSVEAAKREDLEAIVVDDGSTDRGTQEEVERQAKRGVRVIRQENKGLAAARNAGIAATDAAYIFPLDADDRMRTQWLDRGLKILEENNRVGVVYGDAQCFGARAQYWSGRVFDSQLLLDGNYIHASALYRRTIWVENGGYDGKMPVQGFEDWDFWLGALEHGWWFRYLPEVLFDYRQHESSMLTRGMKFDVEVREYLGRKHGVLYWKEFGELLAEVRKGNEERLSIKATSRHLLTLLRTRLKNKVGLKESHNGGR